MAKTEIEFKIRLKSKKEQDQIEKTLNSKYDVKIMDHKHLESDWTFNLNGDFKFRARFLVYLDDKGQLDFKNCKKIITLKLPRNYDKTVISHNEIEFEISKKGFKNDTEFTRIQKILNENGTFKDKISFENWCFALGNCNELLDFDKNVNTFTPRLLAKRHDKIRTTKSFQFYKSLVEMCLDEFPLGNYFIEFSLSSFTVMDLFKEKLPEILEFPEIIVDNRGYGKITNDEKFDLTFQKFL